MSLNQFITESCTCHYVHPAGGLFSMDGVGSPLIAFFSGKLLTKQNTKLNFHANVGGLVVHYEVHILLSF